MIYVIIVSDKKVLFSSVCFVILAYEIVRKEKMVLWYVKNIFIRIYCPKIKKKYGSFLR